MEQLTLNIEVWVNQSEGIAQERLIDHLTGYIYDYYHNEVTLQAVMVTKINGEEVS